MHWFEFDENKSRTNLVKHGIDFVGAQKLWDDPGLIEIQAQSMRIIIYLIATLLAFDTAYATCINHEKSNVGTKKHIDI